MALLGICPREIKISSYKNLYIGVQSSSIHNKLNLGTQMFFSEWMVKQTMASSHHEELVSNKSSKPWVQKQNRETLQGPCREWKEASLKSYLCRVHS